MPHKRKNAKAARSAPEGFSLAFLQQCGMGNKARSEEISFGGRKKILKFLSDLIGATPTMHRQAGDKFATIVENIAEYLESLNVDEIEIPYTTRAWIARRKD